MASAHSEAAERAWAKDSDWIAPLLWRSEFRNALAGALRKKLITPDAAISVAERAEGQFAGREFIVSDRAVMGLVAAISLVTEDRDVLRKFPTLAVSLEQFLRL